MQQNDSYKFGDSGALRHSDADIPRSIAGVLSIDTGTTDDDDASFSVIQAWKFDDQKFYLVEQWREQCEFDELKRKAQRFKLPHRPEAILIEKTSNGPALISEMRRKSTNRHLVVPITPRGSKAARLKRHIDKIRGGRLQLPKHAEFYDKFVAEFVAFPHDRHNDQVDTFTQAADWIEDNRSLAGEPRRPAPQVPMAVGYNSQFSGPDYRKSTTSEPGAPGICAWRGNSQSAYAPNGPFIEARAWVVK